MGRRQDFGSYPILAKKITLQKKLYRREQVKAAHTTFESPTFAAWGQKNHFQAISKKNTLMW